MDKLTDWIRVYDDEGISDFCDRLISFFHSQSNKQIHDEDWRRCKGVGISQSSFQPELLAILRKVFDRYKRETNNGNLSFVRKCESSTIFHYEVNPEKPNLFHLHADAWSIESATRQISVIIYLNDVVEGGATTFSELGKSVQPRKGRILLFPSSFNYMHKGEAPISGDKYIIVSWLHFDGAKHSYSVADLY